jgi:hypothetical protein
MSVGLQLSTASVLAAVGVPANAQRSLPEVTISAPVNRDPVEKSYRKMISGMQLFDRELAALAPGATLTFKLLPRRRDTDMNAIAIEVLGRNIDFTVPVAPDNTFALPRNQQAFDEDAQVIPNRKALSMTWRAEVRSPGLPPGVRRLGDLRLECRVGMTSGLVSNSSHLVGRMVRSVLSGPSYCDRAEPLYLFFADKPLFSVTLAAGERHKTLAIDKLYASASDDPGLKDDLPYCDCEVLLDRTYTLPLGDKSWPDDTRVELEYMEDD